MAQSKSALDRVPNAECRGGKPRGVSMSSVARGLVTLMRGQNGRYRSWSLDGEKIRSEPRSGVLARNEPACELVATRYRQCRLPTLSSDAEGERLDTLSMARMPEPKKATLKTMLSAELDIALGKRPDLQVVSVASGRTTFWRYLDALAPEPRGGRLLPRRRGSKPRSIPATGRTIQGAGSVPQAAQRAARRVTGWRR